MEKRYDFLVVGVGFAGSVVSARLASAGKRVLAIDKRPHVGGKHWGLEPSQLSVSVAARIPVRTNTDDRYFEDVCQFMPVPGYTQMFHKTLDHPNVTLQLGVDFNDVRGRVDASHTVYTGPIDSYFDYCYGKLPYRSVRFEFEYVDGVEFYQPVGQVNLPNEHAYKRITEIEHMTGQRHRGTTILREYPIIGHISSRNTRGMFPYE